MSTQPTGFDIRNSVKQNMTAFCPTCNVTPLASTGLKKPARDPSGGPNLLLLSAQELLPEMTELRRKLHRHPEIGLNLPWTQAQIIEELKKLGLTPLLGKSVSSVVAMIDGAAPGPCIILRGDMDALPLQEDTGLDFASEIKGAMHACGHDTHITMLLGAAKLLVQRKDQFKGKVLLMFQPGEEGFHGARYMLEEGLLSISAPSEVTAAFAVHIHSLYDSGTVHVRGGAMMASADTMEIIIKGKGGHASMPHHAVDPITAAAHVVVALQSAVTRRVNVFDPAVLTISKIEGGTTHNIIPETCRLLGTIRTISQPTRQLVHEMIKTVATSIAASFGTTAEVIITPGYPVTVNNYQFAAGLVKNVAADLIGSDKVNEMPSPVMGAEDFSYIIERVPGAMAFIGARPPHLERAGSPANHSNLVVFHEPPMAVGAALYVAVALEHLPSVTQ